MHRTKLPELLASHYRCVWPGFVLMEHNFSSIGQSCLLLDDCFFQMVQLLAVQVRIKSVASWQIIELMVENSLSIPPNTKKNLPGRQSQLDHRLNQVTTIRPSSFSLFVFESGAFFYHQLPSASEMELICYDSAMIRK